MTEIKIYNTKARAKQVFEPLDPENVRLYVCGPTVYDRAHLGNARPVVVFDVLQRLLRHVYGADHVTYVRNFTDVDDKINATALARKEAGAEGTLEELVHERSNETIDWYLKDMGALGAQEPDQMPRATEYIAPMIAMIEELIAKGHAYPDGAGHVLFAVKSYDNYGALSGRSVDDMIAGARVEVADNKRDPMDFVLWKPSSDDLPGWDSPWGRGRPGWHIECSAMSLELLGASFDIHGGGNDLQFPHHENEIAQSKCAHPEGDFARYWMHNEMLQVEGKKMSKSLGNFFTVRDLLDQGVPGEVIRFVFLGTHYRKPMDWTVEKAVAAESKLEDYVKLVAKFASLEEAKKLAPSSAIIDALADDLNTHLALARLESLANHADWDGLARNLEFLGFYSFEQLENFSDQFHAKTNSLSALATKLHEVRLAAMETKDFSAVDALKAAMTEAGVQIRMSKEGVELEPGPNFDAAKLDGI
ncbi:cysteinyl-tRNA synthetase [Aliiroseovarius crassostreae]|uniref:Cysteine--tRNA ligase n=1 Tax=Aliiroseovarius crassostreae TaxID=154981 RepID=A0A0P7KG28_9RHOB|nr:cysteine--tRNA ligase [Aliiroseovarius crassostreae]KPN62330.1 cysteinyl-tRNA synthetase [Aliiroseovarius crassostreae]SFU64533.1 cysteinyl-tRNA synthetase [Aliiroseovarius crassostreae]